MAWYKKQHRRSLVDMHIEDWDERFLSQLRPEEYVENLKKGNIGAEMLYTQSHVGLCYWPTGTGVMHKALEGRENLVKQIEQCCHRNDIDVIAYYSLVYNNREYDRHPNWRMRSVDGKGSRDTGNRYGLLCPNSQEYRDFTEKQIKEMCDYFDFEGVFFDMCFYPMQCYCDSCRTRWEKEVGGPIPTVVDWKDPRWRLFQRKRAEWTTDFAQFATEALRKYKPGASVEHQFAQAVGHTQFAVSEGISCASDYCGGDLYGGMAEQSYACKLYYGLTQNQPFEYMTSRCYPELIEHTTTKSEDMLRLSVMTTFAHHGACLVIDAIDPVGTLDEQFYERLGKIYKEAAPYEKYLDIGELVYDVALYHDMHSKFDIEVPAYEASRPELVEYEMPMLDALLGAASSLAAHHIPYTVITDYGFERFEKAKVLVLSNVQDFDETHADRILKYVENGGSLYMSGHGSQKLLKEIFGLEHNGLTEETITYMSPTAGGSKLMAGCFTHQHPLVMREKMLTVKGTVKGEVLATLTLPFSTPNPFSSCCTPFKGNGKTLPEDSDTLTRMMRFAAIHSNPPGEYTQMPTMVCAKYGKGQAVWSAAPIERPSREQHREIFSRIITMLTNNDFQFSAKAPDFVECVMFDDAENHKKLVSVLNLQDQFHIPAAYDISISVNCTSKPKRVYLLPSETPMDYHWYDGKVTVYFDKIQCCEMYMIET